MAVTRIRKYKDCIDELAHYYRNGTLDTAQFKRDFPYQVTALSEAMELMRIHRGLSDLYSSDLKDKIKFILSGKEGRSSASNFDPSRDIAFELLLASRCRRAGLRIDIGDKADLVVYYNGIEIFLECKRLKSFDKVNKRIKEALKQLHSRYKTAQSPASARGLLALSITDLINPEHGLIIGSTVQEIGLLLDRHVDSFIFKNKNVWQNTSDQRSIGAFIEFSTPGIIEADNLLTTCHQAGLNNSCPPRTKDFDVLIGLANRLAYSGA
ncbi:MAG: hypothetical protein ABSA71_09565 [Desulfomonilia bacterium]